VGAPIGLLAESEDEIEAAKAKAASVGSSAAAPAPAAAAPPSSPSPGPCRCPSPCCGCLRHAWQGRGLAACREAGQEAQGKPHTVTLRFIQ